MLAVGQRMPAWIDAGFEEYARRMPREAALEVVQIKPEPRSSGASVERLTAAEGKRVRAALPQNSFKVVLDERGEACTTKALARRLETWLMGGRDVAFVIGGPDGLDD